MHYVVELVQTAMNALQVWSPMLLLFFAALTVVVGYLGMVGRFAAR